MATFVSDTFTDTATTALSSHTGETGASWDVSGANRDGEISTTGTMFKPVDGGALIGLASGNPPAADYAVSGLVQVKSVTTASIALLGRVSAGGADFYGIRWNFADGVIDICERDSGGTVNSLAAATTPVSPSASDVYFMTLEMRGNTLLGYFGYPTPSLVVSTTDSTISAAGKVGVRITGSDMGNAAGVHLDLITGATIDQTISPSRLLLEIAQHTPGVVAGIGAGHLGLDARLFSPTITTDQVMSPSRLYLEIGAKPVSATGGIVISPARLHLGAGVKPVTTTIVTNVEILPSLLSMELRLMPVKSGQPLPQGAVAYFIPAQPTATVESAQPIAYLIPSSPVAEIE